MKVILIAVAIAFVTAGCQAIDKSKPPEPGATKIPGHPYWTMPDCKRDQPFGKWDRDCDVPYVGLGRGFSDTGLEIVSPSVPMHASVR